MFNTTSGTLFVASVMMTQKATKVELEDAIQHCLECAPFCKGGGGTKHPQPEKRKQKNV